ncbi:hypothetical protein B0T14DRAFT_517360 [Immersiella caudata]|uniref:Uncharacterized protein n=1 Tax=Immersiella caudata TaxID=314043 RepID=A0AA39WYL6_9PEZI|nr:hypothetical protein B0T14DRAFT_517360 [Immersiella caudata]
MTLSPKTIRVNDAIANSRTKTQQLELRMKMRSITAAAAAAVSACLAASATAQFVAQSQHTAVYTTTVQANRGSDSSPQVIATVVVTLLMPAEAEGYPTQGAPLTGTAISHFSAAAPASSWDKTNDLFWTLGGDVSPGVDTATLTSLHTWTDSRTETGLHLWMGSMSTEWTTTARVTFVEGVGPRYPATIIRTGYTQWEVTMKGGNQVVGTTHRASTTLQYTRITTMVLVPTRPTPLPRQDD